MACSSGNMGTNVSVSPDGNNVLTFVPATDGFPFEDPRFGIWSGLTWWVEELHYGSNVVTVGRTATMAQPSFVLSVSGVASTASTGTRFAITFQVDTDLAPAELTEILIGVAATNSRYASEITGQFCLILENPLFAPTSGDTLLAYDPPGIVESGGLITDWVERTGSGIDFNTTCASGFTPTQPTYVASDADFGTAAVLFDSDSDHRSIPSSNLTALDGVNQDSYWWLVMKTTDAAGMLMGLRDTDCAGGQWRLFMNNGGGTIRNVFGNSGTFMTSNQAIHDGLAHLYEIEYDFANNTVNLYEDASSILSSPASVGATERLNGVQAASSTLVIGRDTSSAGASDLCARFSMAFLMIDTALPSAARKTTVRNYAKNQLGCSGLP